MKRHAITFAIAVAMACAGAASAYAQDNDGCSNTTLRGDYAFTVSGQIFHQNGTIELRTGVAMTHFDGNGGLTQNDFVMTYPDKNGMSSPVPGPTDPTTGFHVGETGTYRVNSDCTGSAEIDMPAPPTGGNGAVIKLMFVLSKGGRAIHTVVTSVTPPSTQPPPSPIIGAIIHSDGWKLGYVNDDNY